MTAVLLRFVIFVVVIGAIYFGVRGIWRDWTRQFRADDQRVRQRDLSERKRPDVIDLKRDGDGVYRPPGERDDR